MSACRFRSHGGAANPTADSLFDNGELPDLLERLTYSTEDARFRRTPKHKAPIDGNVRTGTATLKTAVTLYRDFRNASKLDVTV